MSIKTTLATFIPRTHRTALREIMQFHLCVALFLGIVGFFLQDRLASLLELSPTSALGPVELSSTTSELWFILSRNLVFFLVVSILPFIGSILAGIQFISLGSLVFTIQNQPARAQIDILYRHTIFEILALSASVIISYVLFFAIRDYMRASEAQGRKLLALDLKCLIPLYAVMIASTISGALLEGLAVVHL